MSHYTDENKGCKGVKGQCAKKNLELCRRGISSKELNKKTNSRRLEICKAIKDSIGDKEKLQRCT